LRGFYVDTKRERYCSLSIGRVPAWLNEDIMGLGENH
jgi:hypothetical protein